jgi:hypothetical protein
VACAVLQDRQNVFFTGNAGTGAALPCGHGAQPRRRLIPCSQAETRPAAAPGRSSCPLLLPGTCALSRSSLPVCVPKSPTRPHSSQLTHFCSTQMPTSAPIALSLSPRQVVPAVSHRRAAAVRVRPALLHARRGHGGHGHRSNAHRWWAAARTPCGLGRRMPAWLPAQLAAWRLALKLVLCCSCPCSYCVLSIFARFLVTLHPGIAACSLLSASLLSQLARLAATAIDPSTQPAHAARPPLQARRCTAPWGAGSSTRTATGGACLSARTRSGYETST